jgi:hypothetical protein
MPNSTKLFSLNCSVDGASLTKEKKPNRFKHVDVSELEVFLVSSFSIDV